MPANTRRAQFEATHPSDSEEREAYILAIALEVFGERGLHSTRLSHVARRAQLSLATLKRHFPTSIALFREVVRQTVMAVLPLPHRDINDGSATYALLELTRTCWVLMRSPRFVILQRLVLADLRAAPDLSHLFIGEIVTPLCRTAERIICLGIERGEFRPGNAAGAARLVISTLLGQSLWYSHPEFFHSATGWSEPSALGEVQELVLRCLRGESTWPHTAPPPDGR